MNAATRSIRPFFTHKRMLPKWTGLLATLALTVFVDQLAHWWLVLLGVVVFFPSEYVVHRFVFHHLQDARPGNPFSHEHIAHHEEPADLDSLFNHPVISVGTGVLYFVIAWAISGSVGTAGAFSLGNFLGLVYYEWVHLAAHRPGAMPVTPWGRALKRMHLWHHFKNEHHWFGVTNSAFDHALGSYRDPEAVEKSPTVRTLVPTEEERRIIEG